MAKSQNAAALEMEAGENGTSNLPSPFRVFDDIEWSVDFAMLLLALVVAIVWFTYLTYYHARIIGFIVTKAANWFHSGGRISINSFSISLLSGKIMVADVIYFHRDFTVRIQCACVRFRYWRPYKHRRLGVDDFSHSDARVFVDVTGLEIHVYNQLRRYWQLDKLFDLGVFNYEDFVDCKNRSKGLLKEYEFSGSLETGVLETATAEDVRKRRDRASCWLTLIPRTDFSIVTARISFGNRLLPSTLAVTFDNGKARYFAKAPSNAFDEYLHAVQGSCENFKISFVRSADFTGPYEQPPRTMGEGFVVLQTAELGFYYYQDELGVTRADDLSASDASQPCWGSDLKLGKGTVISYGPWADAQRDKLYRFFFPPDFQEVASFRRHAPGVRRSLTKFDLRISTVHNSTIDIWFVPDDVPHAIHVNFRQGSYCEISVPMIFEEHGYVSTVTGQLMMVESSTSLEYLSLLSSETLEFNICLRYPRRWNELVVWEFFLRGCKSTAWFLFDHKTFLQNLFNEWICNDPPDICKFTPYTYVFDCVFDDVEGVLCLNEHNWIDVSSNNEENCRGAVCGKSLHVSFTIPAVDFMPDVTPLKFAFAGEQVHLKMFFPEQNLLSHQLRVLHSSTKQPWRRKEKGPAPVSWNGLATSEDGWIDCGYADKVVITLVYHLHPMPVRPLWIIPAASSSPRTSDEPRPNAPTSQDPDEVEVEIDIGPCFVQLSGALVIFILSLKENYFGETQAFAEVEKFGYEVVERKCGFADVDGEDFDLRKYRPLHVKVALILRDIEAQLLILDVDSSLQLPVARSEKLAFEMDKKFVETKMQVCVSPVTVRLDSDNQSELQDTRLLLTGFQLRGQALFSAEGLPLDSLTLEYAWLIEVILGDLLGRLTLQHTVQIVRFLETFLQTLINKEESLPLQKYADVCQHAWPRSLCPSSSNGGSLCDSEHELKYKMTRLSIDGIYLCLLESNSALELNAAPVRLTFCTEHTSTGKFGLDLHLPSVSIRQFVKDEAKDSEHEAKGVARGGFGGLAKWLECGKIRITAIDIRLTAPQADSSYYEKRREFQLLHDHRSRRLAFLHRSPRHDYVCGCTGGCVFFGDNRNGLHFTEAAMKQPHVGKLAVAKLESDQSNPGFGQSLLRAQESIVVGVVDLFSQSISEEHLQSSAKCEEVGRPLKLPDFYQEASDVAHGSGTQPSPIFELKDKKNSDQFRSFSDSPSRSPSYVSTVSKNEVAAVNLCYEINRPIICSPLLLSAYDRFLNNYTSRIYQPTVSEFINFSSDNDVSRQCATPGTTFPYFFLERRGLNDVEFSAVVGGDFDGEDLNTMKSESVKKRREKRSMVSGSEGRETTISDLQKVDVFFSVGGECQLFVSPLGVEAVQQCVEKWTTQCSLRHPVGLLMDALYKCSSRRHTQAILLDDCNEEESDTPLRLVATIPRINLNIFQCGIVEKVIPFGHLEHANSIMPASLFITCIERASAHIGLQKATEKKPGRVELTISVGYEKLFFHLTQMIEKGAPTIGISKNASKIGRWIAYDDLHLSQDTTPCVVLEGKVVFVDVFVRKLLKERTTPSCVDDSIASPNTEKKSDAEEPRPILELYNENQSTKNEFSGLMASLAVHFGLLQPLEQSGDNWPLYDLFAPTASAWLHVVYRLASSVSTAVETSRYSLRAPICFLLTEALDCDRVFSVRKSKFEKLKLQRKRLNECPSCQTLLALLRYCVTPEFAGFDRRLSAPEELRESKILRSATVALLSHWREALCANRLVRLNAAAAKKILNSPSFEETKVEPDATVLIDVDGEAKNTLLVPENVDGGKLSSNLQLQRPKSRIESLQPLAAKFDHFAELDTKNATDSTPLINSRVNMDAASTHLPKRHPPVSGSSAKVINFQTGAGAGEDLYEWMKREQENGHFKNRKRKQSRYRRFSGLLGEEINPIEVPLYVYFDFLFGYLKLRRPKKRSPIFDMFGYDFVADFQLDSIVATVNEPKYLELAGSTFKRVTHTERPLIGVSSLTLRADAKYSEEPNKETPLTPLPGSKEEANPPKQAVQSIDYHVNVVACDITVGFPSVTFVNQVVYVVRSTKEAFEELSGARKISDDGQTVYVQSAGPARGVISSVVGTEAKLSTHGDETNPASPELSDEQGEATVQEKATNRETVAIEIGENSPLVDDQHSKRQDGSKRASEKNRRDSAQLQHQPWAKRMLTMLRDFQRAKRTNLRRQSPVTPSPTSEALLVTTVLGAVDCSKVQINAIFTELFAYATFKQVQLGHKSTESWTAVGPSQLRSSDKSVRGALKQINLTLSEAQSMHAIPVNVLTFSVAESNVIFRRYFLEQLSSRGDDLWRNSLGVEIGPVHVDIPLHPGSLHGLVVRGTKNISDRLPFLMTPLVVEEIVHIKKESTIGHYSRKFDKFEKLAVVHFKVNAKEFQVDAALLPSLKASYKMADLSAFGETGSEAKFQIKVPSHDVAFDVKGLSAGSSMSPRIVVAFPTIDSKGAYVHHPQTQSEGSAVLFKEGGYLQIDVEVGSVQHTLTTDLLNQLLFIQEAFAREVGEIIQKIKSEKKPATFWSTASSTATKKQQLLYSIEVTASAIQIMATTPTATAVRLSTENIRFHVSNRLLTKTKQDALERIFGVTELNINLALGQLVRVASHQEVEPEFQQVGYFRTGISMRNLASGGDGNEADQSCGDDGSTAEDATSGNTYLVTLYSPIIFAQPTAVDKALLLWLNYKNAYEFWSEQRSQIRPKSKVMVESRGASAEGGDNVLEQLGSPPLLTAGSLFLQVGVENGLFICVPLYSVRQGNQLRSVDITNSALVISLRNTSIAVCSHGALVCRGRFTEFGLRFVEDFDGDVENWNPLSLSMDPVAIMDVNSCFVPEGTYDICSKTINPLDTLQRARWILNISWKMKGFDMNLNTRIWKLISLLVSTLTSLAATENEHWPAPPSSGRASVGLDERPRSATGEYPTGSDEASSGIDDLSFLSGMVQGKSRKRVLQKTYYDLVARIRKLEQQEADELLVEKERRKLLRLEALLFSDSRRDVVTKLRRQAQKATTSFIDQWGLNAKSTSGEEKTKKRRQHSEIAEPLDVPKQSQGRRFSEFRRQELFTRQPRVNSIDAGSHDLGSLRRISESISPDAADQNLSLDFGDSVDLFGGTRGEWQSQTPDENRYQFDTALPRISFDEDQKSDALVTGAVPSTRTQPPAIDWSLDLGIYVENGKCNFRAVLSKVLEQEIGGGPAIGTASKRCERDSNQRKQRYTSGRTSRLPSQQTAPVHITTIFLPGLNVKASYSSSSGTKGPGDLETATKHVDDEDESNLLGGKHGQLILWMSLEKMPEETVLSPHILDFLEQMLETDLASNVSTMEPASIGQRKSLVSDVISESCEDIRAAIQNLEKAEAEGAGMDASTLVTVASFPLDIVFHLNVQSSQIRFTSQPLAQIECILRLPELQLVGTSRKYSERVGTSFVDVGLKKNLSNSTLLKPVDDDLGGGICVTVLMTGFSVSVFHMYSAGARGGAVSSMVSEKRDALSIHIDTVGISLSRSRISIDNDDASRATADSAPKPNSDNLTSSNLSVNRPSKNLVKVSLVTHMGKAQFKYDMRRLHEILQFPRAWYRRTIFRRLFLGDEIPTTSRVMSTPSIASDESQERRRGDSRTPGEETVRKTLKQSISTSTTEEMASGSEGDEDDVSIGFGLYRKRVASTPAGSQNRPAWDALVLFGISFEELSVDAMMGQVMGETKLLFAVADCQGHFALNSNKNKSVHLSFRLERAELMARQGQVSGLVALQALEAATFVKKNAAATPQSAVAASLDCLDIRVDWMSSPTFIGRWTQLNLSMKDDWRIHEAEVEEGRLTYVEQVSVLLVGKMTWESFRILITQTTVTDIMRIFYKVNEFIDQSLQSGRMALFLHASALPTRTDLTSGKEEADVESDETADQGSSQPRQTVVKRFHRHWQKALALVTSLQLEARDFFPIPSNSTILGGAIEFCGEDLALACFGHNFYSKEWLIFHLREPSIEFSTEAKDISLDSGDLAQLINEDLCFRLGQRQMRKISTAMGTVLCVTGAYAATHSSSIDEWLTHAFVSVLNRVYKIPAPVASKHQYKEAFYIPPFAMHVKTKQIQAAAHVGTSAASPIVEASVIADFEDHVKINVQEVLYLRRFIRAYISRQSEMSASHTSSTASGDRTKQVADPTQELQKDAREYRTTNWHVEPTIRLMSLESMETTDYLWQILGIYQYAVTVSKWLQRGFLDPLDSVVASLMEQILLAEKRSKQK